MERHEDPKRHDDNDAHRAYSFLSSHIHTLMKTPRYMLRDPRAFHKPNEFNPDRWLSPDAHDLLPNPSNLVFGFGQRCAFL